MNFHVLNGATLNGSRVGAILAAAAILCSASASAVGTRQQDALAPTSSSCQVSASAIRVAGAAASVLTEAQFAASTRYTQAAFAAAGGSANVQAFVLREALGFSVVACTANITAIPASVLGSAAWSGGALVTADATKIQPGRSFASADAAVDVLPPVVTRYVVAIGPSCAAHVRAEPAINGTAFSYSDIEASAGADVDVDGLVLRYGDVGISGASDVVAVATHIKPVSGAADGFGAVVVAAPFIESKVLSYAEATGDVAATAERVLMPMAFMAGSSSMSATARQRHGSVVVVLSGGASTLAAGQVHRFGQSHGSIGTASVLVFGVRVALPFAELDAALAIDADAARTTEGFGGFSCQAIIDDAQAIIDRTAIASIAASADIAAESTRIAPGEAVLWTSSAAVSAEALATRMVESSGTHCGADALALADRKAMVGALVDLSCDLDPVPLRTTAGQADISMDHESMEAEATAIMFGESVVAAGVVIEPVPRVIPPSFADVVCSSDVAASARVLPPSFATVDCSSDVAAIALRVRTAEAAVDCGVTIAPAPLRIAMVEASIDGAAEIFADTVSNPDSIDPPERTFVRPPVEAAFIRPEQETYFRRAA